MGDIIKFKIPEPEDFSYIMSDENEIIGVAGKNVDMIYALNGEGFYFNDKYIKREELIAFVLVSGLWADVQDEDYEKT